MFFSKRDTSKICLDDKYDGEFDIEGLNVFAIERISDNKTIISWFDRNGEDQEFTLEVSYDCHKRFLERFRKKLKEREQQLEFSF